MKTSVFKKLCVALLLFCFAGVYGQQNEKVKKLLKGLTKATQAQMMSLDMDAVNSLPAYNLEGDLIKPQDMGKYFSPSGPGKFTMDPYIDGDGKPVLMLLRELNALEQQAMANQLKNAPNGPSGNADQFSSDDAMQEMMRKERAMIDKLLGTKAPTFNVKSIEGKSFDLEKLKGKIVVINFWFIACKPCVMEMPALNKLAKKYKNRKDIVFLGFALDPEKHLKKFLKKTPFAYNIIAKSQNLASKYKAPGYPTNIVLDEEGKYLLYEVGYDPRTLVKLEKVIESRLKK